MLSLVLLILQIPGPIYYPKGVGGVGVQSVSTYDTLPRVVIGTGRRFSRELEDAGPGPAAYIIKAPKGPSYSVRGREMFGTQTFSSARSNPAPDAHPNVETQQTRRKNPPSYSMRSRRIITQTNDFTPAPSDHQEVVPINAKQVLSTKVNPAGIKFGTGPRGNDKAVPQGHEIPAPSDYDTRNALTQLSTIKRPPAASLSSRHKLPRASEIIPDFHDVRPGVGPQVESHIKTAPRISMSGRTKFGSVYK